MDLYIVHLMGEDDYIDRFAKAAKVDPEGLRRPGPQGRLK